MTLLDAPLQAVAVSAAGVAAGTINAVVGSGTMITFPALLAVGLPPITANVSNTVGLVPGAVSSAWGYRRELAGQRGRLLRLGPVSVLGGLTGAVLLLRLPAEAFRAIVPVLIVAACLLVVAQPWLARRAARAGAGSGDGGTPLNLGIFGAGVYGGYFGAAQGVLLLGLMGVLLREPLQRINAVKNVLAGFVNTTAAVFFIVVAEVAWDAVLLVAAGAIVGGLLGARIARRLPDSLLRAVIVLMGVVATWQILTS